MIENGSVADETTSIPRTFTGQPRRRKTRLTVKIADWSARILITLGGIGAIVAVLTVGVYLVWVAWPLFLPATATASKPTARQAGATAPLAMGLDETGKLGWALFPNGDIETRDAMTGDIVSRQRLLTALTAATTTVRGDAIVLGFADGAVRVARIASETTSAPAGKVAAPGGLIFETPKGEKKLLRLKFSVGEPIGPLAPAAIELVDYSSRANGETTASLAKDGSLRLVIVDKRKNLITGATTKTSRSATIPYRPPHGAAPMALLLSGQGDQLYLVWKDGRLARFELSDPSNPTMAETVQLVSSPTVVTAARFLPGKTSLLVGDSDGRTQVYFPTRSRDGGGKEHVTLTRAQAMPAGPAAVAALATSARNRLAAIAYGDGTVRVCHVTSARTLLDLPSPTKPSALAMSPKDDALLALSADSTVRWSLDLKHPESSPRSLFLPVWYESYPAPAHVWQSTSASDDFEPKLGLAPLVFGTLKATLYSMLFAVPLALLAAIYTSEFLAPAAKARIKPTIELMASLPSVVLGFLAALVFAPMVELLVPTVLAAFFTVPFMLLLFGYLWQLLPRALGQRVLAIRFPLICVALPMGLLTAWLAGPWLRDWLFAGDVKKWLDGQVASRPWDWVVPLTPLAAALVSLTFSRYAHRWLTHQTTGWRRSSLAAADLVRFLVGAAATLGLACLVSVILTTFGWDPRGVLVDSYIQRNALVVGFVMGFAVIPIIYTLAEDALSSVPEHLRSASLGAGATPWQTAIRIIVPTAMSGLFSATMVGLGRAVGETMIVLMAAGNTPIMELNVFSGFRTLSANLAVELPEAVRDSSHYRTLFLAALTLFALTFALNTMAELVRQRFRKRAYQL